MPATFGKAALAACALLALSQVAYAQEVSPEQEYARRLKAYQTISPGGETPFGERLNLYTGELSFEQPDITIEGLGPTIRLTRTTATSLYEKGTEAAAFGTWDLSIPRIETIIRDWTGPISEDWQANRCSNFGPPTMVLFEYWHGFELVTEDGGRHPLLKRDPGYTAKPSISYEGQPVAFPIVTQSKWQIGCLPDDGSGEGFLAVSPDGTKYFLNYLAGSPAEFYSNRDEDGIWTRHNRTLARMYVTKVEDRFGNWVGYHYTNGKLTSIDAKDHRRVSIAWNASLSVIESITVQPGSSAPRTWYYAYSTSGAIPFLTNVVLPDGSSWEFGGSFGLDSALSDASLGACGTRTEADLQVPHTTIYTTSITSPSGATGTFKRKGTWHGRSYVASICPPHAPETEGNPQLFGTYSLIERTITGPGLPSMMWSYAYSPAVGSALRDTCAAAGTCADTAYVTVTDPHADKVTYTYSNRWGALEGKLVKREVFDGATEIQTDVLSYAGADNGPYPAHLGDALLGGDPATIDKMETWKPLASKVITQQTRLFKWEVAQNAGKYDFDGFANPETVVRTSYGAGEPTYTQSRLTTYDHYLPTWVLGHVLSVQNLQTQLVESSTTYDATTRLPWKTFAFGKLQQTLTYAPDGTLQSVSDGRDGAVDTSIVANGWKCGIPLAITFADGSTRSAAVGDLCTIDSTTDENGLSTSYTYDAAGRLATINYPDEAALTYNNTTIAFEKVTASEFGISANHWRQTIRTGNGIRQTYFDALLRPLVEQSMDTADQNTRSQVVKRYDAAGRVVYQSYPLRDPSLNYAFVDTGTYTSYDALGRPVEILQDSELGPLQTAIQYADGKRTTTNPNGGVTQERFMTFDQPTFDLPIQVDAPENTRTLITRDVFGKPTSVTRGSSL